MGSNKHRLPAKLESISKNSISTKQNKTSKTKRKNSQTSKIQLQIFGVFVTIWFKV